MSNVVYLPFANASSATTYAITVAEYETHDISSKVDGEAYGDGSFQFTLLDDTAYFLLRQVGASPAATDTVLAQVSAESLADLKSSIDQLSLDVVGYKAEKLSPEYNAKTQAITIHKNADSVEEIGTQLDITVEGLPHALTTETTLEWSATGQHDIPNLGGEAKVQAVDGNDVTVRLEWSATDTNRSEENPIWDYKVTALPDVSGTKRLPVVCGEITLTC